MFLGEYQQAIDDKGKLRLPRPFSPFLAAGFVVTRGFERNLMLMPKRGWQELAAEVQAQSIFRSESRLLRRRLFSSAVAIQPGRSGLISLTPALIEFAKIEDQVVLAGMFDYVEIWSLAEWQKILQAMLR